MWAAGFQCHGGDICGRFAYGWVGLVRSTTFQQFLQQSQARLAMQRLGLLLAAVASLSGAQACQTFAMQCLTMVASGVGKQVHVSANGGHSKCMHWCAELVVGVYATRFM